MLANRCFNARQERHSLDGHKTDFSIINILSNKSSSSDKLNECKKTNGTHTTLEMIPCQKLSKEEWFLRDEQTLPLVCLTCDSSRPIHCDKSSNLDYKKFSGFRSVLLTSPRCPNSPELWTSTLKELGFLRLESQKNSELKRGSLSLPSSPDVLHRPVPLRPLSGGHFTCSTACGHSRNGDAMQNSVSSYSRHKLKRLRTAFSTAQMSVLEKTFKTRHYVIGERRKELANLLGLSETQVKVWFQNRRTKHKKLTQDSSPNEEIF